MRTLLKNTTKVASFTFLSRVLGYVRDMMFADAFERSEFDLFLVAFKVPQFIRKVFSEGGFNQAFIPMIKSLEGSEQEKKIYLDVIFSWLLLISTVLTVLSWLCPGFLVSVFASGIISDADRYQDLLMLVRWVFVCVNLIVLSGFFASVLNSQFKFNLPALLPALQNIVFIAFVLTLPFWFERKIYTLIFALLVASMVQFLILWNKYRKDFSAINLRWKIDERVLKTCRLMLTGVFASSVNQLSILVDYQILSYCTMGAFSWYYFAERIVLLPQGMFGVALVTALTPSLAQHSKKKAWRSYYKDLSWAMICASSLAIPAAVGLVLYAESLTAVLFLGGKFTYNDMENTASMLKVLALGLPGFMWMKILLSAHYAKMDMLMPARSAVVAVMVNIIVSMVGFKFIGHLAIAAGIGCAGYVQVIILSYGLFYENKKMKKFGQYFILSSIEVLMASMVVMCLPVRKVNDFLVMGKIGQVGCLLSDMIWVAVVYFMALWVLGGIKNQWSRKSMRRGSIINALY